MTDEVAELVLEDNRLQTLALVDRRKRGGGGPSRATSGRSSCSSERAGSTARSRGWRPAKMLLRRGQDGRGLTRPELAVVLSMSKLALQDAAEDLAGRRPDAARAELFAAFPKPMRKAHADAIRAHRLRHEILATKVANRSSTGSGPSVALDLTEEEGASLGQVVTAFLVAERLLDLPKLWAEIEESRCPRRCASSCSRSPRERPRASVRHPARDRRRDERRQAVRAAAPGVRKIAAAAAS